MPTSALISTLVHRPSLHTSLTRDHTNTASDLTSLFSWNTKQLFLYITASYPSGSPSTIPQSEVVIWDAIIPSNYPPLHPNTYIHPTSSKSKATSKSKSKQRAAQKAYPLGTSPGIIRLENQKPKYQVTDISGKIASVGNATLQLHWNLQPWVGALVWTNRKTYGRWEGLRGGEQKFEFPALKVSETVKKDDLKTETGMEGRRGSPA